MRIEPAPKKLKRCVVYVRVSSEEQAKGQYTSLDAQRERCMHAVAMHEGDGWVHTATIKDPGYSGKDMNRPGIQELIRRVKANEFDVLLTYRIDRVSRSIMAFYDFYAVLQEHGVELVSLTESFDTSSTVGRLMLNIVLSFAQYERELIQERTTHKMQQHAEHGFWTGTPIPYGYKLVSTSPKERKLAIQESEAQVVRCIFDSYLALQNVQAICDKLQEDGVRTRSRELQRRDGSKRKTGGAPFYKTRVFGMLKNPLYAGKIRWAGKVYEGKHPPIIPFKKFEAVQRLLEKNARKEIQLGRDDHNHLLKGLLRCGACNAALTPYASGKKNKKTGLPYLYYLCTMKIHHARNCKCPLSPLPARAFEATIKQFLKAVSKNSTGLEAALAEARADSNETLGPLRRRHDSLRKEQKTLSNRITNLVDAIARHGLRTPDLKEEIEGAASRRESVEREIEQVTSEIGQAEHQVLDLRTIHENLKAFDSLVDELSLEDQKLLCQLFIKRISVWPDTQKKRPLEDRGVFLTALPKENGRTKDRTIRVKVELYQLPGIDTPTLSELAQFGFCPERYPHGDLNPGPKTENLVS